MNIKLNTKELFMQELRKELRWNCKVSEFKDIILDYEEFFQNGSNNGKLEEELCQEFGSPREIARKVHKENEGLNLSAPCSKSIVKKVLYILATAAIVALYLFNGINLGHTVWYNILFVVGMPVFLWYALGGNYYICAAPVSQKSNRTCFILHVFCVVILIIFWIHNIYGIPYWLSVYPLGSTPEKIGIYIQYVYYAIACIAAASVILAVHFFYKDYRYAFTVICHGIGLFSSILMYVREISSIGVVSGSDVFLVFVPYTIGICLAATVGLYIKKSKRES